MFTRLYVESTQDIVYPTQLSWLAIDGGCPTRIINLREHHYATLTRINIVGKLVGLVGLDGNHAQCVLSNTIAKLSLELLISYSLVAQINLANSQNLLVSILGIANLINKPCVSKCVWVLQRNGLPTLKWEDKVASVEHVEHRTDAVALNLSHVATSLSHSSHSGLHLW